MLQKKYKPSWLLKSINLALLITNIILFLLIISFGVFSPSFFIAFFVLEVLFYLYMGLDFYFQKKNLEAKNKEGSQTPESNTYSYNIFEKCFGIGKSSLQNDKEEQSRMNTAIKDFSMLMTRVSDDLETIEIKLLEDIEILERIHQVIPPFLTDIKSRGY